MKSSSLSSSFFCSKEYTGNYWPQQTDVWQPHCFGPRTKRSCKRVRSEGCRSLRAPPEKRVSIWSWFCRPPPPYRYPFFGGGSEGWRSLRKKGSRVKCRELALVCWQRVRSEGWRSLSKKGSRVKCPELALVCWQRVRSEGWRSLSKKGSHVKCRELALVCWQRAGATIWPCGRHVPNAQ